MTWRLLAQARRSLRAVQGPLDELGSLHAVSQRGLYAKAPAPLASPAYKGRGGRVR